MHLEWKYPLLNNQNTGIQYLELPLPGTRKSKNEIICHSAVLMSIWIGKWRAMKKSSEEAQEILKNCTCPTWIQLSRDQNAHFLPVQCL